jgi:hypothetical protein
MLITIDLMPTSKLYYLEPVDIGPSVRVANSVATSGAPVHYDHVINLGNGPVRIPQRAIIGSPGPMSNDHIPRAHANIKNTERRTHFEQEALTAAIAEIDINPDLESEPIEQLKSLIRSLSRTGAAREQMLTGLANVEMDQTAQIVRTSAIDKSRIWR